jgi:hypothetical protein
MVENRGRKSHEIVPVRAININSRFVIASFISLKPGLKDRNIMGKRIKENNLT